MESTTRHVPFVPRARPRITLSGPETAEGFGLFESAAAIAVECRVAVRGRTKAAGPQLSATMGPVCWGPDRSRRNRDQAGAPPQKSRSTGYRLPGKTDLVYE